MRTSGKFLGAAVIVIAMISQVVGAMGDTRRAAAGAAGNVADAVNDFGFRLLHRLTGGRGGNVIISPLSVSLALSMTAAGAQGDTRAAIMRTLGVESLRGDALDQSNLDLLYMLRQADSSVRVEIANALWAQSGFAIEPDFVTSSQRFYDASIDSLDFIHAPSQAVATINAWVKRETQGKIPAILDRVHPNTRLVLTDAVYFKGGWALPFDPKLTTAGHFRLQDGGHAPAFMMARRGRYSYLETAGFQAIRLPYGNRRFAMYVFLPRTVAGLPAMLGSMDRQHWQQWQGQFAQREGRIVLPRMRPAYAASLNDALKAMGMELAYDTRRADFSRIHPPPPRLAIDDVEHKTFVEVDEEGTRAAAATSVSIAITAVLQEPSPPFEMVVDHPFLCAITEAQSGVILFVGIVTNPGSL